MSRSSVKQIAAAVTLGLASALLFTLSAFGAPLTNHDSSDANAAAKALRIVSGIQGRWQQMPGDIAT
jgi:hypothetical protein